MVPSRQTFDSVKHGYRPKRARRYLMGFHFLFCCLRKVNKRSIERYVEKIIIIIIKQDKKQTNTQHHERRGLTRVQQKMGRIQKRGCMYVLHYQGNALMFFFKRKDIATELLLLYKI